jgi:hypothetical protein
MNYVLGKRILNIFSRENTNIDGDIHWIFLLQTSKSAIHRFCLQMPFRFRKHKGHDLAYD